MQSELQEENQKEKNILEDLLKNTLDWLVKEELLKKLLEEHVKLLEELLKLQKNQFLEETWEVTVKELQQENVLQVLAEKHSSKKLKEEKENSTKSWELVEAVVV